MTRSKGGFGDNLNDRERAKLRGKGHEPDYGPGSEEGSRMVEELGLSGDTTSLRGHKTGSQDTPRNELLGADHVPESNDIIVGGGENTT